MISILFLFSTMFIAFNYSFLTSEIPVQRMPSELQEPPALGVFGPSGSGKSFYVDKIFKNNTELTRVVKATQAESQVLNPDVLRAEYESMPAVIQLHSFLMAYLWIQKTFITTPKIFKKLMDEQTENIKKLSNVFQRKLPSFSVSIEGKKRELILKHNAEITQLNAFVKLVAGDADMIMEELKNMGPNAIDIISPTIRYLYYMFFEYAAAIKKPMLFDEVGGSFEPTIDRLKNLKNKGYVVTVFMLYHQTVVINFLQNAYRMAFNLEDARDASAVVASSYAKIGQFIQSYKDASEETLEIKNNIEKTTQNETYNRLKHVLNNITTADDLERGNKSIDALILCQPESLKDACNRIYATAAKLDEEDKKNEKYSELRELIGNFSYIDLLKSIVFLHLENPEKGKNDMLVKIDPWIAKYHGPNAEDKKACQKELVIDWLTPAQAKTIIKNAFFLKMFLNKPTNNEQDKQIDSKFKKRFNGITKDILTELSDIWPLEKPETAKATHPIDADPSIAPSTTEIPDRATSNKRSTPPVQTQDPAIAPADNM